MLLTITLVVLGAAAVAAAVHFGRPLLPLFSDPQTARDTIGGLGAAAPLAFIGLQVAQMVIAPLPGQVSGLVGGLLFGPWLGLLAARGEREDGGSGRGERQGGLQ